METTNESRDTKSFFVGLMLGIFVGAGTMFLFAPQSGRNTRNQIKEKSVELRDQTIQTVENARDMVKTKANEIADSARQQVGDMQQRGRETFTEQKRRWAPTGKAIKDAVRE